MKESSEGTPLFVSDLICLPHQNPSTAHIGDTFHRQGEQVEPLAGLTPTKAMASTRQRKTVWLLQAHTLTLGLRWDFPCRLK